MEEELYEIEELTRELLNVLEGFWTECRASALDKANSLAQEMQAPDYEHTSVPTAPLHIVGGKLPVRQLHAP